MHKNGLDKDICIEEKKICISLYADDIILLAEKFPGSANYDRCFGYLV